MSEKVRVATTKDLTSAFWAASRVLRSAEKPPKGIVVVISGSQKHYQGIESTDDLTNFVKSRATYGDIVLLYTAKEVKTMIWPVIGSGAKATFEPIEAANPMVVAQQQQKTPVQPATKSIETKILEEMGY